MYFVKTASLMQIHLTALEQFDIEKIFEKWNVAVSLLCYHNIQYEAMQMDNIKNHYKNHIKARKQLSC